MDQHPLVKHESAIDVEGLTGDMAGFVPEEECHGGGDVGWFGETAIGGHLCHCLPCFIGQRGVATGFLASETRDNAVDGDTVTRDLSGKASRHGFHGSFGRSGRWENAPARRLVSGKGRNGDDPTTVRCPEVGQGSAQQIEEGPHHYLNGAVQFAAIELTDRGGECEAGIGHNLIESAEMGDSGLHQSATTIGRKIGKANFYCCTCRRNLLGEVL